jgi:hypothetical protein
LLTITVSSLVAAAPQILSVTGIISSNIEGHSASHFAPVDDTHLTRHAHLSLGGE